MMSRNVADSDQIERILGQLPNNLNKLIKLKNLINV